jgi:nicotinamidase-related amidase
MFLILFYIILYYYFRVNFGKILDFNCKDIKMKALLVIDYIRGVVETGSCAEYLKKHPEILINTNKLIACFRKRNMPITFIRLAFDKSYKGLPKYAPHAKVIREKEKFLLGSSETEFIDLLSYKGNTDIVLNKTYGDPFYNSGLLAFLKKNNITEVVLTGVATDNAILSGASTAMKNNFMVTVIVDACGAPTQQAHENALAMMKGRSANNFYTTQDFLKGFLL